jgi:SnoaL-like domain
MPWPPELFSAPALAHLEVKRRAQGLSVVPYFDGIMTGETDALVAAFAGEPEIHHPVQGRIRGKRAFEAYVADTKAWLADANAELETVELIEAEPRGFGEVVLHLDGDDGRVQLPVAIVADHPDGRIGEIRVYYTLWPLTGQHAVRPPVLQADPAVHEGDIVGIYQRALADGDLDAIVASFEPDGYAREPAGGPYVHRGTDGVRAFFQACFANGGGIPIEHCTVIDDGRTCALEYNVVRWGRTELRPQAGIGVYVRGESGKLAAARIYDDTDPPL